MTGVNETNDDRQLLRNAVIETGAFVLGVQGTTLELAKKPGDEPLSEADLAADSLLRERLGNARPDYGWLSEETTDDLRRLECERVWIIDPIDGTRAYLRGGTDFTVSAALVVGGRPTIAAVFAPARDEFYFAEVGLGSWKNSEAITVSRTASLTNARAIATPGYLESRRLWTRAWPRLNVSQFNSVALRICLVASGLFDFTITSRRKRDWDLAAADLILSEAGGRCMDAQAKAFTYNNENTHQGPILATNSELEPRIFEYHRRKNS